MLNKQEKVHLAKILKKRRRSKRLNLIQAAELAELSPSTVRKIEQGGNAKEGNFFRYGRYLGVEVLKELEEFRKKNNVNYSLEKIVRFPYKVGNYNFELEGRATEMPGYKRIIIVTLLPTLDYKKLASKFQTFEKVAVLKTEVTEIKGEF